MLGEPISTLRPWQNLKTTVRVEAVAADQDQDPVQVEVVEVGPDSPVARPASTRLVELNGRHKDGPAPRTRDLTGA